MGNRKIRFSFSIIFLVLFAVLTLVPFYLMLTISGKSMTQFYENIWAFSLPFHVENFKVAWDTVGIYLFNSVKIAALTSLGTMIISALAGYSFAKFQFPFKNILFIAVIMLTMVPMVLMIVPYFINLRDLGLYNSHWGIILPQIAGGSIMGTFLSKVFFESLSDSILESARIEGAGELRIFGSIILPLSKSILVTIIIMNALSSWNNYLLPLIILKTKTLRTITIGIAFFSGQFSTEFGPMMAAYVIVSVPIIILFMFTMKYYIQGITQGSVKG